MGLEHSTAYISAYMLSSNFSSRSWGDEACDTLLWKLVGLLKNKEISLIIVIWPFSWVLVVISMIIPLLVMWDPFNYLRLSKLEQFWYWKIIKETVYYCYKSKYKNVGVLPIRKVKSKVSSVGPSSETETENKYKKNGWIYIREIIMHVAENKPIGREKQ